MDIHELEDFGADLVKLFKLDCAEHLNVLIAPLKLTAIIHSFCFSQLILHRTDHVLSNLAHLCRCVHVRILCFSPLSDETVKVRLPVDIRQ